MATPTKFDWKTLLAQIVAALVAGLAGGAAGSQIAGPTTPAAQTAAK